MPMMAPPTTDRTGYKRGKARVLRLTWLIFSYLLRDLFRLCCNRSISLHDKELLVQASRGYAVATLTVCIACVYSEKLWRTMRFQYDQMTRT